MKEYDPYPGDDSGLDFDPRYGGKVYNGLKLADNIDDVWIVTHGYSGFDYTKEVIDSFAQYKNVIWSTWVDTPPDVVEYLKATHTIRGDNFVYLLNEYPIERGKSTVNYQRWGLRHGLDEARKRGARYIYKIRNDLDFVNLDRLLAYLKARLQKEGKQLYNLCWDSISNGCCDYGWFGEIDEMEYYWQFEDIENCDERQMIAQYFKRKGWPYDYRYQTAAAKVGFYVRQLKQLGIIINRYKWIEESPLNAHMSNPAVYK